MTDPIRTRDDVRQLGTILGVWAHPDDETFTAAGILAAAVRNGQRVVLVTATNGAAGMEEGQRGVHVGLGHRREQELADALACLGITEHHWLGYDDGCCQDVDETTAAGRIRKLIERVKPDSILTFGPDGLTGHEDHQSVSRWTDRALTGAKHRPQVYHAVIRDDWFERYGRELDAKFDFYFKTDQPPVRPAREIDLDFTLDPELCQCKIAALRAQYSQTSGFFENYDDEWLARAMDLETFVRV